jgi:hypothetical protein
MVKISFEAGKKDLIWIGLVVLVLGFGVVAAAAVAWDTGKTMFHSADDVKVSIGSEDYSLQQAIDNNLIGDSGSGVHFGAWVDMGAGSVSRTAATDGFVIAYTPSAAGGVYDINGYTPAGTLRVKHKSAAVYGEDPTQHFTMPVRKGDTWKVTGSIGQIWWIPLSD